MIFYKIVKQSEEYIVERIGRYDRTLKSGFNILIPFIDRVVGRLDMRTQIIDSPPQPVITKDNVTMQVDTVVYYQITDSFKAVYEISNLVQAIRHLTTTTLRDIIGTLELDKTLSSREDINTKLRIVLDEATDKWGVRVERVELKTIELPNDLKNAMEAQMRAEREKRAAILTSEGKKQSAITEAEGQKAAQILRAESEKESAILHAEAEKESKIRLAEGQADAILKVAESEAEGLRKIYSALKNAEIDENMLSVKYVEALTEMAKGNNKVFVPYESQGFLGNIGMIKELISDKTN